MFPSGCEAVIKPSYHTIPSNGLKSSLADTFVFLNTCFICYLFIFIVDIE